MTSFISTGKENSLPAEMNEVIYFREYKYVIKVAHMQAGYIFLTVSK